MQNNTWKQNLHLEPKNGWLNDPNGLAYFNGEYHIFHQYSYEVNGGLKHWYYYTSKDLINYVNKGVLVSPSIPEDKDGVYSGSAHIEGNKLVFYYTGNVKNKDREDYDYVHSGRGHNTIKFSLNSDGSFSEKECVLKNKDYPNMSNHVRDPKIFEKDNNEYLVLGARDSNDYGCLLIYKNLSNLEYFKTIYSKKNLGFMWECPDYFEVDGQEIFVFSPQGITLMYPEYKNIYQIGYSIVKEGIENLESINNFTILDYGHDFYASQTFLDEKGNRVLSAWMAVPDSNYSNPVVNYGYQHCLTVFRKLSYHNEKLCQSIHSSVKNLFSEEIKNSDFNEKTWYYKQEKEAEFSIKIDSFEVNYSNGILSVVMGETGYGRDDRKFNLIISNVEIIFDSSSIELFANNGEFTFTSRFYPESHNVRIESKDYIAKKINSINVIGE